MSTNIQEAISKVKASNGQYRIVPSQNAHNIEVFDGTSWVVVLSNATMAICEDVIKNASSGNVILG